MQTYLPYKDFNKTAQCLDDKRLRSQLNECKVLIRAIEHPKMAWGNHPVTKMWRGYKDGLKAYMKAISDECKSRGFHYVEMEEVTDFTMPKWYDNDFVQDHYKAKLLAKQPDHYSQFNWDVKPDIRSWYPVKWGKLQRVGYGK